MWTLAQVSLAERIERARKRVLEGMTKEELDQKIRELEEELGIVRGRVQLIRDTVASKQFCEPEG